MAGFEVSPEGCTGSRPVNGPTVSQFDLRMFFTKAFHVGRNRLFQPQVRQHLVGHARHGELACQPKDLREIDLPEPL